MSDTMQDPKQLVQRKIRQLAFLHARYVESQYGKIPVDQAREYQRLYADCDKDVRGGCIAWGFVK